MSNIIKKIFFSCILISLIVLLSGCPGGEDNKKESGDKKGQGSQSKNSEALRMMEKDVDDIISMFSSISNEPGKGMQSQKTKQQGQQGQQQGSQQQGSQQQGGQQQSGQQGQGQGGQQGGQKGGSQGGQQQGQNQQQGGQQQGGQQQGQQHGQAGKQKGKGPLELEPEVDWDQAIKSVEKIHTDWNDYTAQAIKDGVGKNDIDGFSNALNELTDHVESRARSQSVLAANKLSYYIAGFWAVYNSDVPPDLKRIKYYLRNVIFYSDMKEWQKTRENLDMAESTFKMLRTSLEKDKSEEVNKIQFSLSELSKVVKDQNYPLVKMKGKLAVDNIISLEKDMEKKKGSGQGSGESSGGQGSNQ
jgi:hypothetical protein